LLVLRVFSANPTTGFNANLSTRFDPLILKASRPVFFSTYPSQTEGDF